MSERLQVGGREKGIGSRKPSGSVTCVFLGVCVFWMMGSCFDLCVASSFVLFLGWVESAIITALVGSTVTVRSWGHTGAPDTQGK